MGDFDVGAVVGRLQLKDDGFTKTLGDAGKGILALSAGISAITASAIAMAQHTAEVRGEIIGLARTAGVSAKEFSGLSFAAKMSGVDVEMLGKAMNKLNVPVEKTAETLARLGISSKNANGTIKTSSQLLYEAADKIQKLDAGSRAAAARGLFGEEGARMVGLLSKGKEGIMAFVEQAKKMGLYFDDKAAAQVQEYNKNIKILKLSFEGLTQSIGQSVIEYINSTGANKQLAESVQKVTQFINELDPGMKNFIITFAGALAGAVALSAGIAAVAAAVSFIGAPVLAAAVAFGVLAAGFYKLTTALKEGRVSALAWLGVLWLIFPALAPLVTIVTVMVTKWQQITATFRAVADAGKPLIEFVKGFYAAAYKLTPLYPIVEGLAKVFNFFKGKATDFTIPDLGPMLVEKLVNPVTEKAAQAAGYLSGAFAKAWEIVKSIFDKGDVSLKGSTEKIKKAAEFEAAASLRTAQAASAERLRILREEYKKKEEIEKGGSGAGTGQLGNISKFVAPDIPSLETSFGEAASRAALVFNDKFRSDSQKISKQAVADALNSKKSQEEAEKAGRDAAKAYEDGWSRLIGATIDKFIDSIKSVWTAMQQASIQALQNMAARFSLASDIYMGKVKAQHERELEEFQNAEDKKVQIAEEGWAAREALLNSELAAKLAAMDAEFAARVARERAAFEASEAIVQQDSSNYQQALLNKAVMEGDWMQYLDQLNRQHEDDKRQAAQEANDSIKSQQEQHDLDMNALAAQRSDQEKAIKQRQADEEKRLTKLSAAIKWRQDVEIFNQEKKMKSQSVIATAIAEAAKAAVAIIGAWAAMTAGLGTGAGVAIAAGVAATILGGALASNAKISAMQAPLPPADLFLASGGPVYGPGTGTSDSIPAMLSNGEYVVNARAASQNKAMLDAINGGSRMPPTWSPTFVFNGAMDEGGARKFVDYVSQELGQRITRERY